MKGSTKLGFFVLVLCLALVAVALWTLSRQSKGLGDPSPQPKLEDRGVVMKGPSRSQAGARDMAQVNLDGQEAVRDEERPPDESVPERNKGELTTLATGADIIISGVRSDGLLSIQFPLLRPTVSDDREFFVFGLSPGAPPSLQLVHIHKHSDPDDLRLLINLEVWDRFDRVVITTPEWGGETARILAAIGYDVARSTLSCPGDSVLSCEVADYSLIGSDGFPILRRRDLEPGASIAVDPQHVDLVFLSATTPVNREGAQR